MNLLRRENIEKGSLVQAGLKLTVAEDYGSSCPHLPDARITGVQYYHFHLD